MGSGRFSDDDYHVSRSTRASQGRPDFEYTRTATKIHSTLDPKRIPNKPFGLLESRDSVEHPISTPIIVTFDVTGSNIRNAEKAQQQLPELMGKLTAILDNPQVAIWANDDVRVEHQNAIQLGEFESDNRIDETIRNIWLTGNGGGNGGESYDLLLYAAAHKVVTDSFEKRGKKGYMIMYCDELFFPETRANEVREVFGDGAERNIPLAEVIEEAKRKWDIYILWPQNGYHESRRQYIELFGDDHVEILESPNQLCDKVTSIVAAGELRYQNNAANAVAAADGDYANRVE